MDDKTQMLNIFQELYDSEINFSISTFWDGGFETKLGDDVNSFLAHTICDTMIEVAEFLKRSAIVYYPKSDFSKKYSVK